MSRRAGVVLVIAGLLVAGIAWMSSMPGPGSAAGPGSNPPAVPTAQGKEEWALETGRTDLTRQPSERAISETAPAEDAVGSSSDDDNATIVGCLVDDRGVPVVGAEARLVGILDATPSRPGTPASSWDNHVGLSNGRGCFEVAFAPPADRKFELRLERPGYALRVWRWESIAPGEHIDLGRVRLQRGAELLVSVLDGEGRPFLSGWRGELSGRVEGSSVVLYARPGDGGVLEFGSVPPGDWEVRVRGVTRPDQLSAHVSLTEGERKETALHARGAPHLHSLRVDVIPLRYLPLDRSIEGVRLIAADGSILEPDPPAAAAGVVRTSFTFADLAPGAHRIAIRDPRFEDWYGEASIPENDIVFARLAGSATLALTVRHDGADVVEYAAQLVSVRGAERRSYPLDGGSPESSSPELNPEKGVYRGIVPGTWWLEVTSPGLGRTERFLGEILPGERRTVTIELQMAVSVGGRVEDEHGTPPLGAIVRLTRRENGIAQPAEAVLACDARGRFRFESVEPGTYWLQAFLNGFASARAEVATRGMEDTAEVVVTFAGCAHLRGRVIVPDECGGSELDVALAGSPGEPVAWLAKTDPSGRFDLGPVTPGSYRTLFRPTEGSAGLEFLDGASLEDTVLLAAGVQERDFTLPSAGWGELLVRVRVDGRVVESVWVNAIVGGAWARKRVILGEESVLGPFPTGPCRLWVAPDDGSWCHVVREDIQVRKCERTPIDIRCELVQGRLRVFDPAGAPMVGRNLVVRMASGAGGLMALRVIPDAEGFVLLTLPIGGRFQVGRPADASGNLLPDPGGEFDWHAGGPSPAEVRIAAE